MKSAQKLQQENAKLRAEIKQQSKVYEQTLKDKNTYIQNLEAALIDLKKYRFGSSSEKQNNVQTALFNEAEVLTETKAKKAKGKKKKSGKRKPLPKTLEREDKVYKPEQTTCPHDGAKLIYAGEEVSEQLKFIPAHVKVIRHIRHKLACPQCKQHIVTAR